MFQANDQGPHTPVTPETFAVWRREMAERIAVEAGATKKVEFLIDTLVREVQLMVELSCDLICHGLLLTHCRIRHGECLSQASSKNDDTTSGLDWSTRMALLLACIPLAAPPTRFQPTPLVSSSLTTATFSPTVSQSMGNDRLAALPTVALR